MLTFIKPKLNSFTGVSLTSFKHFLKYLKSMPVDLMNNILILGALIVASVLASKITSKFGIPILLVFIVVGMVSGSDGLGGIYFDNSKIAQILGTFSLILILFSGGLNTKLTDVKVVFKEVGLLSTLGVVISTAITGVVVHYLLGWAWLASFLLGAVISSTDAAAVFGVFRGKNLGLKPKVQSLLEFESGSNDPMAVLITINLITIMTTSENLVWTSLIFKLFSQFTLGLIFGWALALFVVKMINLLDLESEGLYPVLTLTGSICIYALSEYCGGNGFLAVYIAGITMSSKRYFSKKTLSLFHDGLSWVAQCIMFLTLGLLVYPTALSPVAFSGVFLVIVLAFIARPLSVGIILYWFKYSWREILFISWGGLRGAVPIILATYTLVDGIEESNLIFNLVFFVVLASMTLQGMSLEWVAKKLKVQEENLGPMFAPFFSTALHRDFISYDILPGSKLIGTAILELNLPEDILVVLIKRKGKEFIPRGSTEFAAGDQIICLSNQNHLPILNELFSQ